MNKFVNIFLIIGMAPFITHCAAISGQGSNTDLRLRNLETRITKLERATNAITAQNKGQAEIGLTVDNIQAQVLQIKGYLEENKRQLSQVEKKSKEQTTSLNQHLEKRIQESSTGITVKTDEKFAEINANQDKLAELLSKTMQKVDSIEQARAQHAADLADAATKAVREAQQLSQHQQKKPIKETAKRPVKKEIPKISPTNNKIKVDKKETKTAQKPTTPKDKKQTSKKPAPSLYDKGLGLFKAKEYKEAYNTLLSYLDKEPKGEMAPNARYWLGDCLFNQNEYELAILEYQKVIADFPKHDKTPASLYKQALAFEKLKDNDTAKLVYQKLLEDFPKSDQAPMAQKWLKKH